MSIENKNRIEVQDAIIASIDEGLSALGHAGWTVMEYAPAKFASFDKVISLQLMRTHNVGWQGHRIVVVDGVTKTLEDWVEQQSWQVQVILKRKGRIDQTSILAEDVASDLVAWINSEAGISSFRKAGIAPQIVDNKLIFVYNDNSEIYQKRAVFTVKVQVPKAITIDSITMDTVKPRIKPI